MDVLQNVKVLMSNEFEKLVGQTWPDKAGFSCQAEFEWASDQDCLLRNLSARTDESITEWLEDEAFFLSPHAVLEALIDEGVLEPGDYVISMLC
jgi:hypothetical protein